MLEIAQLVDGRGGIRTQVFLGLGATACSSPGFLASWLPGCALAGLAPGRYEWEQPMERSELMDHRAAAGWPKPWVIRAYIL